VGGGGLALVPEETVKQFNSRNEVDINLDKTEDSPSPVSSSKAFKKAHRRSRSVDPSDLTVVNAIPIKENPRGKDPLHKTTPVSRQLSHVDALEWGVLLDDASLTSLSSSTSTSPSGSPPNSTSLIHQAKPRGKSNIGKIWKGVKNSVTNLLSHNAEKKKDQATTPPRPRKLAFSGSNTSHKSPGDIIEEMEIVLLKNNISYTIHSNYFLRCEVDEPEPVTFDMEICAVPRLSNTFFVHMNRISGNEWRYKALMDVLLVQMNL